MSYEEQRNPGEKTQDKHLLKKLDKLSHENKLLKKLLKEQESFDPEASGETNHHEEFGDVFTPSVFHEIFFNELPFLIWAKDLKGRYLAVNPTFAALFEKKPSDFKGLNDYDFSPKVFADKFRADDKTVVRTNSQMVIEELIPLTRGFRWHETIKTPLRNEKGEVYGVAGFAKDITERKNYELATRESEEKFRELAENTTDSFILRSNKKILYANPAFEQIYGYSRSQLKNDPELDSKCIHPDDRERIEKVFGSSIYRSTYIFNEQYRIIKADESVSWIWNRSYPVWNDKGEVYHIVSVATNITEIKKLEENLRKSRLQQKAILDNIPHLAWLKDNEGKYLSANQSFCRYFNIKPEDVPGKTDYDFCSPELADGFIKKDNLVLKERRSMLFYETEDMENGKKYSETYKSPVINEEGEVIGITGISRDITDQKLSEQALQQSEEKFKDIVTLLPEVVFETDEEGTIRFTNLRGFQMMDYTQEDLSGGINILDVIAPEDTHRVKAAFERIKAGTELKGMEFTVITKRGKRIPVLVFTNNIFLEGRWMGIRGVMVDITRRKRSEAQEREYQAKLLFLSNTALDFLGMTQNDEIYEYIGSKLHEFITDAEIIVNSFNKEKKVMKPEYFSFTPGAMEVMADILGQSREEFVIEMNDEGIEELRKYAHHLRTFERGFFESSLGKIPLQKAEEMEKFIRARRFYGIALMKSGILFGSVLIITRTGELQDKPFIETFIYQAAISLHRSQLEKELLEAKNKAEETDKLKTAFLANMSHEIRTPMNGILGLAQLLSKNELSENEKGEYLKMIDINGKLLLNLVNDIIDISRIESNQVDIKESEFSLNNLLDELESFMHSEKMVKNKKEINLKLVKPLQDHESCLIADQSKIKQIFTNLISNSLKFTNSGEIIFGYEPQPDDEILFFVKDTGIGIPEDKLKVIFDRFTQGDQSLTRPYGGSGLGLAICKGFVERMGGRIWVESHREKGSAFYFILPLKTTRTKKSNIKEEKIEMKPFDWSDIYILVVEDNFVSFKLLEASLSKTGVKIIHAEDGRSAIEKVREHPEIDLVLMDIQLPVLNGYDSTREIKKLRPELPVIAQTANAMDDDRLKCLNAGCSDYITKPIVLEKLYGIVNEYIVTDK